jgi:hypothetical protein
MIEITRYRQLFGKDPPRSFKNKHGIYVPSRLLTKIKEAETLHKEALNSGFPKEEGYTFNEVRTFLKSEARSKEGYSIPTKGRSIDYKKLTQELRENNYLIG